MVLNLKKGDTISLKKAAPELKRLMCGLGWDVASSLIPFGSSFDLDASVLCLNTENKLRGNDDVIYYANLKHSSGAIAHLGDNLTGEGEGDDEQIVVDLPAVPAEIGRLVFVANIYKAEERHQDFGRVSNAFIRLVDLDRHQEVARFDLSGSAYTNKTGTIMAEVYRHNDEWQVAAVGTGIHVSSLAELAKLYH